MENVKLVLGTMTFGESVFAPDVEAFIRVFLEAGYDELDTAYVYNEGRCEQLLGEALRAIGTYSICIFPTPTRRSLPSSKPAPSCTGRASSRSWA